MRYLVSLALFVVAAPTAAAKVEYSKAVQLSGSISDEDYPPAAIRANAEGVTVASFDIATSGRVTACRITESSGSAALDNQTCDIILQRFVYQPAKVGRQIVPETRVQRVLWKMPAGGPFKMPSVPSGPFGTAIAVDVDEQGQITDCKVLEHSMPASPMLDPCAQVKSPNMGGFTDKDGHPTKARIILKNSMELQPR